MSWRRFGVLLALVWLLVLVGAYTITHWPLTAGVALALGSVAVDVLAVAGTVASAGALGTAIVPRLGALTELERVAARTLLGLALISVAVLAMGLAGLLIRLWPAIPAVVLLVLIRRPLIAWLDDLRAGLRRAFAPPADSFSCWLRRGVVLLIGLSAVLALLPPIAWDALTYHVTGPATYLDAGRIVSVVDNHFLGFPQLVEMLYLWVMMLARPNAVALLHGVFGVLLLMLLLGAAERLDRPAAGWIAAAVLLSSETIWGEFSISYNDLALMAYAAAALDFALIWGQENSDASGEGTLNRWRYLVLAGLFTGAMIGVKYTAAGCTVGIGVMVAWLARRGGLRRMSGAVGIVAGVALAAFTPWLLKNLFIDGNPVSPFIWGTAGYDALDQQIYLRPGTGLSLAELVAIPLRSTIFGRGSFGPFEASTGPLWVGLLPLAAFGWRRRPEIERQTIAGLVIFMLMAYGIWLAGAATSLWLAQLRLLFPLFPAAALIGGLGFVGASDALLSRDRALINFAVGVALGLSALIGPLEALRQNPLPVLAGLRTEEDYLTDQLQAYYIAIEAVNALPADARVQFLWEPRTGYCRRECIPDSLIDDWWHARQLEPDPQIIARDWADNGVTHVLVYEAGLHYVMDEEPHQPMSAADEQAFDTLRGTILIPVWDELPAYTLYKLQVPGE